MKEVHRNNPSIAGLKSIENFIADRTKASLTERCSRSQEKKKGAER